MLLCDAFGDSGKLYKVSKIRNELPDNDLEPHQNFITPVRENCAILAARATVLRGFALLTLGAWMPVKYPTNERRYIARGILEEVKHAS